MQLNTTIQKMAEYKSLQAKLYLHYKHQKKTSQIFRSILEPATEAESGHRREITRDDKHT